MNDSSNQNFKSLNEIDSEIKTNGKARNSDRVNAKSSKGLEIENSCRNRIRNIESEIGNIAKKDIKELNKVNAEVSFRNNADNDLENKSQSSKLNPETEIFTESDPDEVKIRKAIKEKFSHNKKNKNQPL